MRERRGSGGSVKQKCAKIQKREMIQQDGELHKPRVRLKPSVQREPALGGWHRGQGHIKKGLESHAHPTGLQFAGKKPYLWSSYTPQSPFLCPSTISSEVGCYNLTRPFTQAVPQFSSVQSLSRVQLFATP